MNEARERMLTRHIEGRGVKNAAVLAAFRKVDRAAFVPSALRSEAFEDNPLPIGEGQTISQPYIVAVMTELLDPKPGGKILEIGTGSGYQAAILAAMDVRVYSIDILPGLSRAAEERLKRLGYGTVALRVGDGYEGWPEQAPFDGILITCSVPEIPAQLLRQLRPGGRMVLPVGPTGGIQELTVAEKIDDNRHAAREVMSVRFVPLTGPHMRD